MKLSDLTSVAAVQAALDEFSASGQASFLERHGFGKASGYLVRNPRDGSWADSKAIAGVALAYQFPGTGGLLATQFSGGLATVQRRLQMLGFEVKRLEDVGGRDWTADEVTLIVADYLAMLSFELNGQRYNKADHRRRLLDRLPGRSAGAVEFKHCNISAVMLELGFPYLNGYLPRSNFQRSLLMHEVSRQVIRHRALDEAALLAVQRPALEPVSPDFSAVKADAPAREVVASEVAPAYTRPPVQRDYLAREANNRSLGAAGEVFALRFERWRLRQLGAGELAERVEHVSATEGDGLGYDIRSFEHDGCERYIEVKTVRPVSRTGSARGAGLPRRHALHVEFRSSHGWRHLRLPALSYPSPVRQYRLGRLNAQHQRCGGVIHHREQEAPGFRVAVRRRAGILGLIGYIAGGSTPGLGRNRGRWLKLPQCGIPLRWLDAFQAAEQSSLGVIAGWNVEPRRLVKEGSQVRCDEGRPMAAASLRRGYGCGAWHLRGLWAWSAQEGHQPDAMPGHVGQVALTQGIKEGLGPMCLQRFCHGEP